MHTPRFWISLKHPFIAVPGNKQMGVPAVIKNVRIARRKLCGFVQGVSRLLRMLQRKLDNSEPHPSDSILRIGHGFLAQNGQGFVQPIQPVLGDAQEEIRAAKLWIQMQRLLKARDSFLVASLFFTDQTEVEISGSEIRRFFRNGSKAFGCRLQISAAHGFGGLTKVVVHTGGPLGASSRNQTTRPTQEKKGQALDQRLASCQRVCCWPSDYKQMTGWHNNSPHKFYTCYRQGQGTVSFNKKPSGWDVSQRVR